jgi:cytochrome b6-f complex iron-sulfur subunit
MNRRAVLWLIGGTVTVAASVASLLSIPYVMRFFSRRLTADIESSTLFPIGRISDFAVGVDTRFLQSHRVCVVRNAERLYLIYARCTHMGCTPDWRKQENDFKCPCHGSHFCMGSAFDENGIHCNGPAPRPLDRAHVEIDSDGYLFADTNRLYQWPEGKRSTFDDPGAFVPVRS